MPPEIVMVYLGRFGKINDKSEGEIISSIFKFFKSRLISYPEMEHMARNPHPVVTWILLSKEKQ